MPLDVIVSIAGIEELLAAVLARVGLLAFVLSQMELQCLLLVCRKRTTVLMAKNVRGLPQMVNLNVNEDSLAAAKGARAGFLSAFIATLESSKFIVLFLQLLPFLNGINFVVLHNLIYN